MCEKMLTYSSKIQGTLRHGKHAPSLWGVVEAVQRYSVAPDVTWSESQTYVDMIVNLVDLG
jgi:hypothetical protein